MASKSSKSAKPKLAAVPSEGEAVVVKPTAVEVPKITIVANDVSADDAAGDDSTLAKADAYKLKELLAAVVTKTGAKKKDAKDVLDAVLAEMAAALSAGKSLNLPPLGNLRVAKTQEKGGATMMVLKLRMGGGAGGKDAKDTLADDGEDS